MTFCLHDPEAGYYATRPALGADGDFITAPETSQMFGELIGLWCAQSWLDMGSPDAFTLIECGPGRGLMMADALRAARALPAFEAAARVLLVEPSVRLRAAQAETLGDRVAWIARIEDAPAGPAIVLGNEFLDCLPIRQCIRTESGWRERLVGAGEDGGLAFGLAPAAAPEALIPAALRDAPIGSVAEQCAALESIVAALAARGGPLRALFIDYGSAETTGGNTFQAVRAHASADPLDDPGGADLTAHVDFPRLAALARAAGLDVTSPIAQGDFLRALGIEARAAALAQARPGKGDVIQRQLQRLIAPEQMGGLFRAICLSSPGLPQPAAF
ncbi:MAG: class I SAM-dependent methyltransferase [Hyphomonadaceae bacterium]